jgi:putative DNA primase/helicase
VTVATDNIVRLAALADNGELPPAAEDAIALDFAERHHGELRYVALWSRWLNYDDTRWQLDDTLHVFDRARALCREVAATCERAAAAVASAKTVAAVERLARADRRLAATAEQWDGNGWALNTDGREDDNNSGNL